MTVDFNLTEHEFDNSAGQLEKIVQSLELMIELQDSRSQHEKKEFAALNSRIDKLEEMLAATNPQVGEADSEPDYQALSNNWQAQKEKILAAYGLDGDDEPAEDSPTLPEAACDLPESEMESETETETELADPVDDGKTVDDLELSEAESLEIESLKSELREKIREAEVELAIKQAKLEQQEARVEERFAQLERREIELSKRAQNLGAGDHSPGVLGRLKRQLNFLAKIRGDNKDQSSESESRDFLLKHSIEQVVKPQAPKQPLTDESIESVAVQSPSGDMALDTNQQLNRNADAQDDVEVTDQLENEKSRRKNNRRRRRR